eukprot:403359968
MQKQNLAGSNNSISTMFQSNNQQQQLQHHNVNHQPSKQSKQYIKVEGESSGPPSILIGYGSNNLDEKSTSQMNDSTILQSMQHSMNIVNLPQIQQQNSFGKSNDYNNGRKDLSQKENLTENINGIQKKKNQGFDLNSTKKTLVMSDSNSNLNLNSQHKVRFAEEVFVAEISCRSSTDISKESMNFTNSLSPRKMLLAPQLLQKVVPNLAQNMNLNQNNSLHSNNVNQCSHSQNNSQMLLNQTASSCSMMERIQEAKNNNRKYELLIDEFKKDQAIEGNLQQQNDQKDIINLIEAQCLNDKNNNSYDETSNYMKLEQKVLSEASVKHATVNLMELRQSFNDQTILQSQSVTDFQDQQFKAIETNKNIQKSFKSFVNPNTSIEDKQYNKALTIGSQTQRGKRQSLEFSSNNGGTSRNNKNSKPKISQNQPQQQLNYKQLFITAGNSFQSKLSQNHPSSKMSKVMSTQALTARTNKGSTEKNQSLQKSKPQLLRKQNPKTQINTDLSFKRTSSVPRFSHIPQTTSTAQMNLHRNGSLFKSFIIQPPASGRLNQNLPNQMTASMISDMNSLNNDLKLLLRDDQRNTKNNRYSSVKSRSRSQEGLSQDRRLSHMRKVNQSNGRSSSNLSQGSKLNRFFQQDSQDVTKKLETANQSLLSNREGSQKSTKSYSLIQKALMKAQATHERQLQSQMSTQPSLIQQSQQTYHQKKQFLMDQNTLKQSSKTEGVNGQLKSSQSMLKLVNHESVVNSNKTPHFNNGQNSNVNQTRGSSIEKNQNENGILRKLSLLSESQNSNQFNLMSALKMSSPSTLNGDTPQKHYQVLMSPLPPQSEEQISYTNDNEYQFNLNNPSQLVPVRFSMKNIDIRSSLEKECGISPQVETNKNPQTSNMQILYQLSAQKQQQMQYLLNNDIDEQKINSEMTSMQQQNLMLGNVTNFSSSMTTPFSKNNSLNQQNSLNNFNYYNQSLQQSKIHSSNVNGQNLDNKNTDKLNSGGLQSLNSSNQVNKQFVGPVFFSGESDLQNHNNKLNNKQPVQTEKNFDKDQPLVIFVCPYQCDNCRIQESNSSTLENISQAIQHSQKLRSSLSPDSQEETLEQLIQKQKEIEMKIQRLLNNTNK